jgi:hypothetical protein
LHVRLAEVINLGVALAVVHIGTEVYTVTVVSIVALALPATVNVDALGLSKAVVHAVSLRGRVHLAVLASLITTESTSGVDVLALIDILVAVWSFPPWGTDTLPVVRNTLPLVIAGSAVLARDVNAVIVVNTDVRLRRDRRDDNGITPSPVLRALAEPTLTVASDGSGISIDGVGVDALLVVVHCA